MLAPQPTKADGDEMTTKRRGWGMAKAKRGLLRHTMAAELPKESAPAALESGTYLAVSEEAARAKRVAEQVTLIVYGWQNVEPGTLSWVFPSYEAALRAARAMRNAVRWAIVAGKRHATSLPSLDEARAHGRVLAEEG